VTDSRLVRGMELPLGAEEVREEGASEAWPKEGKPEEHCLLMEIGALTESPAVEMKWHFRYLRLPHSRLESTLLRFDSPQHAGMQLGNSGRVPKAMSSM